MSYQKTKEILDKALEEYYKHLIPEETEESGEEEED